VHRLSRTEIIMALNRSFSDILYIRTTTPPSRRLQVYTGQLLAIHNKPYFANSPIMSAILAMSFDELQADVQRREAFD
jgi:hypothetical protein